MFLRVLAFLLLIIFCNSCDQLLRTHRSKNTPLNTFVDFSSVDFSPSFSNCDSIITKQEKSTCFRNTMHTKISAALLQHPFTLKESISETVFVHLLISANGIIVLDKIQSPTSIRKQLPTLDSLLQVTINNLPKISPAIKRGIPVITKYRLPIEIDIK